MGAWIEITTEYEYNPIENVAPLVGAWIEIKRDNSTLLPRADVAPLVGAWIEICVWLPFKVPAVSLPLWERGLK